MKDTNAHASDGIAVFSVVGCKSYLDKAFKSIFFFKGKNQAICISSNKRSILGYIFDFYFKE